MAFSTVAFVLALLSLQVTAFNPSPLHAKIVGKAKTSVGCSRAPFSMMAQEVQRRQMVGTLSYLAGAAAASGLGIENAVAVDGDTMTIVTTEGKMVFELWSDVAPKTVESFKTLADKGFFDGQAFHRIIKGFVIQGGDPNSKKGYLPDGSLSSKDAGQKYRWGTGGPGYNIKAEFNPRKHEFGVLSMARSASPDSAGSQFFVCLGTLPFLDNQYTTFGRMLEGEEVLKKLGNAETIKPGDVPIKRQGIETITIGK